MPNVDAWHQLAPGSADVDFTMRYIAHDAFTRDLWRMASACERGQALTSGPLAGWTMFTKQLHIHHATEDISLWPKLRAEVSVRDETGLADSIHTLATNLAAHMRHEEKEALPLIARYLGSAGRAEFGQDIRKTQGGLRGGVEYVPWVLDAPQTAHARFLRLLPTPARLLYRLVWSPKYNRTTRWDTAPDASDESLPNGGP
jgi:hypothetical protein